MTYPTTYAVVLLIPMHPAHTPIVTYSWILAYQNYDDPEKARILKDVMAWGLTDGQAFGPELGYVPLPEVVVEKAIASLNNIGTEPSD